MRRWMPLALILGMLVPIVLSAPAQAQSTRTWVSATGDDANPCSRTSPCLTFSTAISKTNWGGEINCIDSGGYGAVTITKSITIDCSGVLGSILVGVGNGVTIASDSASGMIVRLRSLSFNGILNGARGISITGTGSNDNAVSIEDCVIDGFNTAGISNSAKLGRFMVKNTVSRNNNGPAVTIAVPSGTTAVKATLDNVSTLDSVYGFAFGNGAQVLIKNSIAQQHTNSGVEADPGATVSITSTSIVGNVTGILASPGTTVQIRDSDVVYNSTGINGTVQSHVNNSFLNNGAGGSVTPIGTVSSPQGLQ